MSQTKIVVSLAKEKRSWLKVEHQYHVQITVNEEKD